MAQYEAIKRMPAHVDSVNGKVLKASDIVFDRTTKISPEGQVERIWIKAGLTAKQAADALQELLSGRWEPAANRSHMRDKGDQSVLGPKVVFAVCGLVCPIIFTPFFCLFLFLSSSWSMTMMGRSLRLSLSFLKRC